MNADEFLNRAKTKIAQIDEWKKEGHDIETIRRMIQDETRKENPLVWLINEERKKQPMPISDKVILYLFDSNMRGAGPSNETGGLYLQAALLQDTFKCKGCGKCCKEIKRIAWLDEDIERVSEFQGVSREFFLRKYREYFKNNQKKRGHNEAEHVLKISENGACPFLKDNRCSIYEVRPLVCRAFPFFSEAHLSESLKSNSFTLDPVCQEVMPHFKTISEKLSELEVLE